MRFGLRAAVVGFIGAPLTIVAHELARALMVLAVGGTPHIRFVWVAFDIPNNGSRSWTGTHTFLITLAGPLFTLLTAVIAVVFVRRRNITRQTPATHESIVLYLIWTVVLGAVVRALLEMGHTLQWWQLGGVGTSRLLPDTVRIEFYFGLPPGSLVAANLLLSIFLMLITTQRLRAVPHLMIGGVVGTIAGVLLWLLVVGPVLLNAL